MAVIGAQRRGAARGVPGVPGAAGAAKHARIKAASSRRLKGRTREDAAPPSAEPSRGRVDAAARIGTVVAGKWRLDVLLGVGGMATVYAATHRNGHRVAIKVLHPTMAHDATLRERFLREGYAANRVEHEGVVRVLDDDELDDGTPFLVMELLTGETLEARWQDADMRMPLGEVLAVADDLLYVLAAAHDKGIHHRDIKPDNVFLARGGRLKVLDFGIARIREDMPGGATTTRTGIALGTPAFMPPEQALGKSREVDGRSDLWAVGATMFALLSGRFVHLTDSPSEMLVKAATERAAPLASVLPDVPEIVAAIVDRALAFEQDARYPDAATMRRAVQEARAALGLGRSAPTFQPPAALGGPGGFLSTHSTVPDASASARASAAARAVAVTLAADSTPPPTVASVPAPAMARPQRSRLGASAFPVGLFAVVSLLALVSIVGARRNAPVASSSSSSLATAQAEALVLSEEHAATERQVLARLSPVEPTEAAPPLPTPSASTAAAPKPPKAKAARWAPRHAARPVARIDSRH